MKKIIYVIVLVSLCYSCDTQLKQQNIEVTKNPTLKVDSTIFGKYKKQPLPSDFSYKIIEDKSDISLEKNQLSIELNKKITVEQIATLSEKLYNSKQVQRRFYIFYSIQGENTAIGSWATSHFDPNLKIEIIGATQEQENKMKESVKIVEGDIIGKWKESKYTNSTYILMKKNNKIILKVFYSNGQITEEEMKSTKQNNQAKLQYKSGEYNGEYFILKADNNLAFYNSEGKNFTTATATVIK